MASDDVKTMTGGCMCGAVRYSAEISSGKVAACHCGMCRRWTGGVALALDNVSNLVFEDEKNIGKFSSSGWGERWFCKTCGSSLLWRSDQLHLTALMAGSLDDQDGLSLTDEIFVDCKPVYYGFANETKKLTEAEVMAQFMPGDSAD